jgi:hypothetical protein
MMTFDTLKIESAIQSEVTSRYGARLSEVGNIEHIFDSPTRRFNLLLSALKEVFQPYGEEWVGANFDIDCVPLVPLDSYLAEALKSLSSESRYISLHLFDTLDYKRRSIVSLLASSRREGRPAGEAEFTAEEYMDAEKLYLGLSETNPQIMTLVNWIHETLLDNNSFRNFAFKLGENRRNKLPEPWSQVEFPFDYCAQKYSESTLLSELASTKQVRITAQDAASALISASLDGSLVNFAANLERVTGVKPQPDQTSQIALAFYIWQATIGIMPYYFRGIAWSVPGLDKLTAVPSERPPTFIAISCSTYKAGLNKPHLQLLNSIARGLAGAIAICGIELARSIRAKVYLPRMLEHEIGSELVNISERLAEFVDFVPRHVMDAEGSRANLILDSINKEIFYINWCYGRLLENADPDSIPKGVEEAEQVGMWPDVFSQMILRAKPPMNKVTIKVDRGDRLATLKLGSPNIFQELASFDWPPPLMVTRYYLRRMLVILISNAINKGGAVEIEIRLSTRTAPQGYITISVWDDGERPYLGEEKESVVRPKFGHRIIRGIIAALKIYEFPAADFILPKDNAVGPDKVFKLILPLNQKVLG